MLSLTGKQLGAYQIVERIDGRPAYEAERPSLSQVYRATAPATGESVAVKVFSANLLSQEARTRLRDALRAVSQLRHPGVAPILGSGVVEGQPYIVMPYFSAGSLADRYERGLASSLDPSGLLNELAAVLDAAHQRGLVHGSLKPSKLLFDPESGSLALEGLGESVTRAGPTGQSEPGGLIYAAPEVAAGQPPTPAADQYSFGVLAAELLTGLPVEDAFGYLRARSVGRSFEHRKLVRSLNAQTLLAVSKATAAAPGQRFATVGEANRSLQIALGKLAPVIEGSPAPAPKASEKRPRRRRAAATLLAILMLGLLGIVPALAAGLIELPAWAGGGSNEPTSGQLSSDPSVLLPPEELQPRDVGYSGEGIGGEVPTLSPGDTTSPVSVGSDGAGLAGAISTPTPDAGAQLPGLTATSPAPTPTVPASATPAPTNTPPPTAAPTNPPPPTPDNKKCKDDPSHPNYCTPVPTP